LIFDVILLVGRDADLYDDMGKWLRKSIGKHADCILPLMAMVTGQHDAMAELFTRRVDTATDDKERTEAYKTWRRREVLKQCGQSELLASTLLIFIAVAELAADEDIMLNLKTEAARKQGLQNFAVTLVFQLGALKLSDNILRYKEASEVKGNGRVMSLPPNKTHHIFLTHKKEHKETEEWAVHVKDQLKTRGFEVFFDVDNLQSISTEALNQAIADSCVLLVFLDDVTFKSQWCCDEIREAHRQGLAIRFIVHTDRYITRTLISQWFQEAPDVAKLAFAEQALEYSTTFRDVAISKIAGVLEALEGVRPLSTMFEVAQAHESKRKAPSSGGARRRGSTMSMLLQADSDSPKKPTPEDKWLLAFRICAVITIVSMAGNLTRNLRLVPTGA
jgi:hypothetical protein